MGVWINICVVYIGVSLNAFRTHPLSPALAKENKACSDLGTRLVLLRSPECRCPHINKPGAPSAARSFSCHG